MIQHYAFMVKVAAIPELEIVEVAHDSQWVEVSKNLTTMEHRRLSWLYHILVDHQMQDSSRTLALGVDKIRHFSTERKLCPLHLLSLMVSARAPWAQGEISDH